MQTTQTTQTGPAKRRLSDRTLNRLIIGIVVVLAIGIPLVGVIYFLDRSADPGPSMAQRAMTTAEDAVRTTPNDVAARMALAAAYIKNQRLPDALAQYTEVLKAVPDHHGALLGRGNVYLALKDDANATKDFQRLVDIAKLGESASADPQMEEAYFRLGDIEYRAGKYTQAIDALNAALMIDRSDADAMNLLGAALIQTGKAQDALVPLNAAVKFVPTGWCDPYQHLAEAYAALGNADGASYANGMVAFCQGQPEVATKALSGLTGGAFGVQALLGLGEIAELAGDTATATSYYGKVLAQDPQDFNAMTGLQRLGTAPTATPGASAAPGGAQVPAATEAPAPSEAPAASPSTGANP